MSGYQRFHVVHFAIRRFAAVIRNAVPTCDAFFYIADRQGSERLFGRLLNTTARRRSASRRRSRSRRNNRNSFCLFCASGGEKNTSRQRHRSACGTKGSFKRDTQERRAVKRLAERASDFFHCLAAASRALCAYHFLYRPSEERWMQLRATAFRPLPGAQNIKLGLRFGLRTGNLVSKRRQVNFFLDLCRVHVYT